MQYSKQRSRYKNTRERVYQIALILGVMSLFAGAAGQGGGYYLFLVIIPSCLFIPNQNHLVTRKMIFRLGLACIFLCLVFSFANFYNSITPLPDLARPLIERPHLSFKDQLQSQFPSALFFSGFVFIYWSAMRFKKRSKPSIDVRSIYENAFLWSSVILLIYICFQVLTGYDFRAILAYRSDHQYTNGFYRAQGFYSHPLALASVSLAVFAYFLWLSATSTIRRGMRIAITLIYYVIILASGARVAFTVATLSCIFAIIFVSKMYFKKINKYLYFLTLVLMSTLLYFSGMAHRFAEAFQRTDERFYFWKIYWRLFLDRPWFGHGQAWISVYRDQYYNNLGYQSLERKYHAHNVYLQTLADAGIIGSIAVLLLFLVVVYTTKFLFYSQKNIWPAFMFSVFVNFVHGFTQNTFYDPAVMYLYLHLLIIGLHVKLTEKV